MPSPSQHIVQCNHASHLLPNFPLPASPNLKPPSQSPRQPLPRPPHNRLIKYPILLHDTPIHTLPPRLQIPPLPSNAPIPQPEMLPRAHPQQYLRARSPQSHSRVQRAGCGAEGSRCSARAEFGDGGGVFGVHVDGLFAVVCAGEGGAGYIRTEDRQRRVVGGIRLPGRVGFQEPDEAGAEHGGGGGEEGFFEGVGGGEGGREALAEERGHGSWGWRERRHCVVRVPGHGGGVEEGGHGGVAGMGEEEVAGWAAGIFRCCGE